MAWGPVEVTTDRLVVLSSSDASVVAPLQAQLEWQGAQLGEADARVMPRGPGDKAKVLHDGALCTGCVYYGGAFGNDMPDGTVHVVVGDVALTASPAQGTAPLATTFAWTGLTPQADPYTCTLDFGDGTPAATIQDCANVTSKAHTYAASSALANADGAFQATLSVVGTQKAVHARVPVDWTFTASPTEGQAPFDVTFAWSGLDPAAAPLTCTFDPGDGSPAQAVASCGVSGSLTHRYTSAGSFSPGLAVSGAGRTTLKAVAVTGTSTSVCPDLSALAGWQGSVSFSYQGSGATSDAQVSVQRSFNGDVLLDTQALGFPQPLEWTGKAAAGASFAYRDTDSVYDQSNGTWNAVTINGVGVDAGRSAASLTFSEASGSCTVTLGMSPWVVTDYGSASTPIAMVTLILPYPAFSAVQGSADMPIYTWSNGDSGDYVSLDGQIGIGFSYDLMSVVGGAQNMGTAHVTWNLAPIAAGP